MEPKALVKARRRLRVAEENVKALSASRNHETFADRWYVFLHAAKGIYTTLDQGSKASPQARQWFGARNQERRSDPLLRYISEARNDDEHGLNETTRIEAQSLALGVQSPGSSSVMRDQFGNTFRNCGSAYLISGGHFAMRNLPRLTALDSKPVKNVFSPSRIVLQSVTDRSGKIYDPPKEHLGKPLHTGSPEEVAALTITYLKRLLEEAGAFD